MALLETMLLEGNDYTFQQLRHMFEAARGMLQEGVVGPTDYKVSQRAAGANLSVDVAAGDAWVNLDTGTRQGYYLQTNDGTVNVAIAAAHATLPRVDQVILQINDSNVPAGSGNLPELKVLTGTPTAGATLDNRLGAAALGNDRIRLADVHVPATDTTIADAQIRDRRPWARGAFRQVPTISGTSRTTSSTSFVQISADYVMRLETSGEPLEVDWIYSAAQLNVVGNMFVAAGLDGAAAGVSTRRATADAFVEEFGVVRMLIPTHSAGSHLISLLWAVSAGTATLFSTAGQAQVWSVRERLAANADNGVV